MARLESLLRRSAWMKGAAAAGAGDDDNDDKTRSARFGEQKAGGDTFSFCGKTIDFAELELRSLGNTIHLTVMEAEFLRYLVRARAAWFRASPFSKMCGDCTKTRIRAPSIFCRPAAALH